MSSSFNLLGVSSPLKVKLENNERGYYASLHQQADPQDTNKLGGAQAVQFFKRSGLSVDILRKIWILSSSNGETLNREEFYVALKLISYQQNGIELSKENIMKNVPSPLPKFQTKVEEVNEQISDDVYKIHVEQEKKYISYVAQLDPYNSKFIQTAMAMQFFLKSQLPLFQLQNIMNLINPSLSSSIKITIQQFTITIHLISLVKQGIVLPNLLPQCLVSYMQQQGTISSQQLPIEQQLGMSPVLGNQIEFKSPELYPSVVIPQITQQTTQQKSVSLVELSLQTNEKTIHSQPTITHQAINFNTLPIQPTQPQSLANTSLLEFDSFVSTPSLIKPEVKQEAKYSAFDNIPSELPVAIKIETKEIPQTFQKNTEQDLLHKGVQIVKELENIQSSMGQVQPVSNSTSKCDQIQMHSIKQLEQQTKQVKQAQDEFRQINDENQQRISEAQQQLLQNVTDSNLFLSELRTQNQALLKQQDQELEFLVALNDSYKSILKKIQDENDFFHSDFKEGEKKKRDILTKLSVNVKNLNQQYGLNVSLKEDSRSKGLQLAEEISSYTQGVLTEVGKTLQSEQVQRQRREEQIQKDLKDQKNSITVLEKNLKSLQASQNRKTDYSNIDRQPIQMEINPLELSISSQKKSNSKAVDKAELDQIQELEVRRGSVDMDKPPPQIHDEGIKSVGIMQNGAFRDFPDLKPQVSDPLISLGFNSPQKQIQSDPVQSGINGATLEIQQIPKLEDLKVDVAEDPFNFQNLEFFKNSEEMQSKVHQISPKQTEKDQEVHIEFDISTQFGGNWQEFDTNFPSDGFGQKQQENIKVDFNFGLVDIPAPIQNTEDGFGFKFEAGEVKPVVKEEGFDSFKWF